MLDLVGLESCPFKDACAHSVNDRRDRRMRHALHREDGNSAFSGIVSADRYSDTLDSRVTHEVGGMGILDYESAINHGRARGLSRGGIRIVKDQSRANAFDHSGYSTSRSAGNVQEPSAF